MLVPLVPSNSTRERMMAIPLEEEDDAILADQLADQQQQHKQNEPSRGRQQSRLLDEPSQHRGEPEKRSRQQAELASRAKGSSRPRADGLSQSNELDSQVSRVEAMTRRDNSGGGDDGAKIECTTRRDGGGARRGVAAAADLRMRRGGGGGTRGCSGVGTRHGGGARRWARHAGSVRKKTWRRSPLAATARGCECPGNITLDEKCSILLDDSAEKWSFRPDGGASTLKYIASLVKEKDSLKAKIAKLQSNLRMGLEIEQHLQLHLQALYDDFLRTGLSELQKFHEYQRTQIMKMLEEESSQLRAVIAEIQEKLSKNFISNEISENPVDMLQSCDSSCKDVHVTTDVGPNTSTSPKVCFPKQSMLSHSAYMLEKHVL
ncbi:hypothetical protein PR202_ga31002 [Eleusine coracana subsp. coracana]|uniref:Uncharacterized protein n=1 Tax=Eleusine coracana subsp. coracana TaxID=191504 RepID=A0AAV5DQU0_ELECO|nr:hypothetical protein PR202_ga31002 [Eleusine coracana subsp. coracana]